MAILPLTMTDQGLQPQKPADLHNQLIASVAAVNPDYTANLPGSLIEDISSTDVAACLQSDSFLVDLVNSVAPTGANAFILRQLGVLYGLIPQDVNNTSVFVVFYGPPGFVIQPGFVVGDGTYQYVLQDGGIIGTGGTTLPLYAVAQGPGIWAVPVGAVTQILTSVSSTIPLTCINPEQGIPSTNGEDITTYRDRVMTAGLAASVGMARYVKTLLSNIPGVQSRLVSVVERPVTDTNIGSWAVICGGGDPYQVAYAIYQSDFYLPGLTGAFIQVVYMTNSNPVYIQTANNHNLIDGDVETIHGVVGLWQINGQALPITVYSPTVFSMPFDTTYLGTYQYGGIVTPNPINELVTVTDFPDSYTIPYIIPNQETVSIHIIWNTDLPNYVSQTGVAQASIPAIVDYINRLPAGTTPINLNDLTAIFLDATNNILPSQRVIRLLFTVYLNGYAQTPAAGTQTIPGDPYSYFYTDPGGSAITVVEG